MNLPCDSNQIGCRVANPSPVGAFGDAAEPRFLLHGNEADFAAILCDLDQQLSIHESTSADRYHLAKLGAAVHLAVASVLKALPKEQSDRLVVAIGNQLPIRTVVWLAASNGDDHVVTLTDSRVLSFEQLDGNLAVGADANEAILFCVVEDRQGKAGEAEIVGMVNDANLWMLVGEAIENAAGSVGTSVIDDQEFEVIGDLRNDIEDISDNRFDGFFFVVGWARDGQARPLGSITHVWTQALLVW